MGFFERPEAWSAPKRVWIVHVGGQDGPDKVAGGAGPRSRGTDLSVG